VVAKFLGPAVPFFLDLLKDVDAQPIFFRSLIPSQNKKVYDQGADGADDRTPEIPQPDYHESPERVVIEPAKKFIESPPTRDLQSATPVA